MNPHEVKPYLDSFINHELNLKSIPRSEFKLKRMKHLLDLLGRPQEELKCIHVAGSKGKGSTCTFTAHILKSAGYRVGLYTSPHINDFKERIRVLDSKRGAGSSPFKSPLAPLFTLPAGRQERGEYFSDSTQGEDNKSPLLKKGPACRTGRDLGGFSNVAVSQYFITPHFESEEIFNDCIRDEELCFLFEEMKPSLEETRKTAEYGRLSYFEVLTALAFCYFRQQKVDFAILETGLGGRLDATNVVEALVYGITPISLEHTQVLGETLESIAAEKAAIIKNELWARAHNLASANAGKARRRTREANSSVAVVIAPQTPEAFEVIEARCRQEGVTFTLVGRDITYKCVSQDIGGQVFEVRGINKKYNLNTKLLGTHQVINAVTAIGLVESLKAFGITVSRQAVEQGILETVWPGRFEILQQKPTVVLDSAHNPESSQKLIETVQDVFPGKKIILVLGLSDDKDKLTICRNLATISQDIILTIADHPRASRFTDQEAAEMFKGRKCVRTNTVREAVRIALKKAADEDIVLVTGSIFVIGEAREMCTAVAATKEINCHGGATTT